MQKTLLFLVMSQKGRVSHIHFQKLQEPPDSHDRVQVSNSESGVEEYSVNFTGYCWVLATRLVPDGPDARCSRIFPLSFSLKRNMENCIMMS